MKFPNETSQATMRTKTQLPDWKQELDLENLSDRELVFLSVCQSIHRGDDGSATPFENFFDALVTSVELGRKPTPETVRQMLLRFQRNVDAMIELGKVTEHPPAAERNSRHRINRRGCRLKPVAQLIN